VKLSSAAKLHKVCGQVFGLKIVERTYGLSVDDLTEIDALLVRRRRMRARSASCVVDFRISPGRAAMRRM